MLFEEGEVYDPEIGAIAKREGAISLFDKRDIIAPEDADEALTKVAQVLDIIRQHAIAKTTAADYVNMGGKPYVVSKSLAHLGPLLGIQVVPGTTDFKVIEDPIEKGPDGEPLKIVWCSGRVMCKITKLEADFVGSRELDDEFLRSKNAADAIYKAAESNMKTRAVRTLADLEVVTWAELAQYGNKGKGIKKEDVARVDFKEKDKAIPLDAAKMAYVRKLLMAVSDNDPEKSGDILFEITTYTFKKDGKDVEVKGVRASKDIKSDRQLDIVHEKLLEKARREKIEIPGGDPWPKK